MARVFYIGAPSHVNLPKDASLEDRLVATGNNTGNLLIGHALKKQLKIDSLGQGMSTDKNYIEENFDYIVIGSSNFLFKNFDFSQYADFLENIQLPCVIIGLGAQAPSYEDKVEIPEGTKRMMKIISERSTTLGVRGYFSASVLEQLGITNVRVIGCPSIYWTCNPIMTLFNQRYNEDFQIAINGSIYTVPHTIDTKAGSKVEALLAKLAFVHGYPYILQNEIREMSMMAGVELENEKSLILSLKKRYGLSGISDKDFMKFIRTNMKVFFDVEEWMHYIRSYNFVIGTRFHGCLIALLNEIPSVIFVHDARTREMCELLNIPHVDIRKVEKIDLKMLYELMDLNLLRSTYTLLYHNYIDFLDENKIEHNLERLNMQQNSG